MKIGITGATGFIARHLAAAARQAGHELVGYSRTPRSLPGFADVRPWQPVAQADFTELDAVVHLAGESLLGLWTAKKRHAIRRSRVDDTLALVARLRELPRPPRVLVSAGGSAFYGDAGDAELTEAAPAGSGFIAEVARAWDESAMKAADLCRVVTLRTGMVLGADGGAAPVLRRTFRLCMGGRLGSGRQWMPWIHVTDLARLILHAVENESLRGPVNAVAPAAVRNADFTRVLARTLHRPALLPVPAFILKCLPGAMSDIFLASQRMVPVAAQAAGFVWQFPELPAAVRDLFA